MEEILRAFVKPEIVAAAFSGGGGVTWLVMGYLTGQVPDKWWNPLAALCGVLATILAGLSAHYIADVSDLAGAVLAGAVAGVVVLNVGHRSPKKTVTKAVEQGALKPEAVETLALPKAEEQ